MKTIEFDQRLPVWLNDVLNRWPFAVHKDAVATVFTAAYDSEGWYRPESRSLFYNGYFFTRVTWPFGVWVHMKPRINRRIQLGLGWKLNGRLGFTCRVWQTDESAAAGVQGANFGQARYWNRGTA